ncbi:MAG: patatin-like phospholipase family protein [Rhodospirillales bacterium]
MSEIKHLNLALQGGGAHGAFTWGVLDRLLEDERIEIEGISGTSAGAINAAVLAQGYAENGRAGARATLDKFWRDLSRYSLFSPAQRSLADWITGNWNLDRSPGVVWFDMIARLFSPYDSNPGHFDLRRDMLSKRIDMDRVRACHQLKLFVCATNVRTGQAKVFTRDELSIDVLLASACLPTMFQAVVIDGQPYWDGGYMGNPAIWPLIYYCQARDVAIVQINPLVREGVPKTTAEILNRMNEINFNASLIAEMRAIATVKKLIEEGALSGEATTRYKNMLIHLIADDPEMGNLGAASKFNLDIAFLLHLKETGRNAAALWLKDNFDKIGYHSSVDIRATFL